MTYRTAPTVLIGGFGRAGMPFALIDGLVESGARDLTVVNNNAGNGTTGLAALLAAGQVRKMICSFPRQSDSFIFDGLYRAGKIELEVVPQGNLAERIRAAGAGIGGFYTPTGVGTPLAEGKETRRIDGRDYVLEFPIRGDVALVARPRGRPDGQPGLPQDGPQLRADHGRRGGHDHRRGRRGRAARWVGPGERRHARHLRRPGGGHARPLRRGGARMTEHTDRGPLSRDEMAQAVARDIPKGSFVNLGIGQPTWWTTTSTPEQEVVLHTENGMLGMGPEAHGDEIDPDLINAGKVPVTELPGASYFHHADSFAMMRGGHLDVCVLGAFQVAANGDLANWHTGAPDAIPAVGGAMDLAIGAKDVYVMMTLFAKDGSPKLVDRCTYPLTGSAASPGSTPSSGSSTSRPPGSCAATRSGSAPRS